MKERGSVLIVVIVMTAILLILSSVAMRMVLSSRQANSQAKQQLQEEASKIKIQP